MRNLYGHIIDFERWEGEIEHARNVCVSNPGEFRTEPSLSLFSFRKIYKLESKLLNREVFTIESKTSVPITECAKALSNPSSAVHLTNRHTEEDKNTYMFNDSTKTEIDHPCDFKPHISSLT